jgi:protein-disulfide isomerase
MKLRQTAPLLLAGLLLATTQEYCVAQTVQPSKPGTAQIEQIVHDYLLSHPEVVLESVRAFDARAKVAEKQQVRDNINAHLNELYNNSPAVQSADKTASTVTLVEFFDYRCGYCKKVEGTVAELAKRPGVRIVYKDFPILGPDSLLAAQAALAAEKQGAYENLHRAMLASEAPLTQELIEKLAAEAGLNIAQLKKDMVSPEVSAQLARNRELAEKLNVQATPTFIVGGEMVSGALPAQAFQSLIDAARQQSAPAAAHTATAAVPNGRGE